MPESKKAVSKAAGNLIDLMAERNMQIGRYAVYGDNDRPIMVIAIAVEECAPKLALAAKLIEEYKYER
jgi:hypothetical protein